jgi:hypothetical protein
MAGYYDDEIEPLEGMDCPECSGTGSVGVIIGDEQCAAPCPDCGGAGRVLTRDELANLPDLRLVPDFDATGDPRDLHGNETIALEDVA